MATFVVIFLGLVAVVLIVTPLVWSYARENAHLQTCLKDAQQIVAETLRHAEYYRMACEHAPDGLLIQDMAGRVIWSNPAYERIHGLGAADIIGRNPLEYALPAHAKPTPDEIAAFRYDPTDPALSGLTLFENQHADGTLFWNQISVSFRRSADGRENAILVCRDVTEQVQQSQTLADTTELLKHEASHDSLTGLANRSAFLRFFETTLQDNDRHPVGLLHIDLDNFKSINDTHGHSAGDAVLIHTANTIRSSISPADMVARVGGDEFVVVCPSIGHLEFLDAVAKSIINALAEPFEWSNLLLQCEASIGAALSQDTSADKAEDLLVQADFALYEAKRAGRNRSNLYDEDMHQRHTAQTARAAELAHAIDTNALDYVFQPTLDVMSGEIVGVETLVRWSNPDGSVVAPDEFLPIAENLGLMSRLDLCSMTAALAKKRRLNSAGFHDVGIAFNASPDLLTDPDFINRLVWGVEAANIDRSHVTIEVLETTDFGDALLATSHASVIKDLRQAGFQVHLDDFGIGFAGLSHLATLDVSGVKIDRSLIRNLLTDQTKAKIVRKTIELSNDLGLTVIAEGVEDLEIAQALESMGCAIIQGYWLSKPLQAKDLHDWLAARRHRRGQLWA